MNSSVLQSHTLCSLLLHPSTGLCLCLCLCMIITMFMLMFIFAPERLLLCIHSYYMMNRTPFGILLHVVETYHSLSSKYQFLSQRKWVFATNSNFVITISLQHQCRRSLLFQTMNSVSSNSLSFEYQRLASSGCRDIGVKNSSLWKIRNSSVLNLVKIKELKNLILKGTIVTIGII